MNAASLYSHQQAEDSQLPKDQSLICGTAETYEAYKVALRDRKD